MSNPRTASPRRKPPTSAPDDAVIGARGVGRYRARFGFVTIEVSPEGVPRSRHVPLGTVVDGDDPVVAHSPDSFELVTP